MNKIAFVFPGQGAQHIGMAKEFYKIPKFKSYFEEANEKLDFDLEKIMLQGPADELKQTYITQPAILLHSILALKFLKNKLDLKPTFTAGHSLGEFSALVAADVLDWKDALYLVHKRGKFMMEANDGTPYKMAAVLGLEPYMISEICQNTEGTVVTANFNTPGQTVISGEKSAVSNAMKKCNDKGAKRIVPLVVGGAFHSPLIRKSANWLQAEMENIDFRKAKFPIISNFTAKPESEPDEIVDNLKNQIVSPVRWVESVEYMSENGIDTIIEFGPKKVVSRMIRSIDRNIKRYTISKPDDVEKVLKYLRNNL